MTEKKEISLTEFYKKYSGEDIPEYHKEYIKLLESNESTKIALTPYRYGKSIFIKVAEEWLKKKK